jgi:hypothetical protein
MTPLWFDRSEISELLTRRLAGFQAGYRQNVALLGLEGMGKTTLLKRFLEEGRKQYGSPIWIYLEVGEDDSWVEWASRFIQSLLYGGLRQPHKDLPPSGLDQLLSSAQSSIPLTASEASKTLEMAQAGKVEEAYRRLLDLPQRLFQETGRQTVWILDEFHRLPMLLPVREPFRILGRAMMLQGHTWFLMASSQPDLARNILKEGLSLLFGQLEVLEVGPLSDAACWKILNPLARQMGWDRTLVAFWMQLIQGHPKRLDLWLKYLTMKTVDKEHADPIADLVDWLEPLWLEPTSLLCKEFENNLRKLPSDRNRLIWIQTLCAIASGVHRPRLLAETIHRSLHTVCQIVHILHENQLVKRNGSFVYIPDRMFRLWLKTAYPLLHGVGWTDSDWARVRMEFKAVLSDWLTRTFESAKTPLADRVEALMRCWEDDRVEWDGKRITLPRCERLKREVGYQDKPLWWMKRRAGKKEWDGWILLWEGFVNEQEARGLVQWIRTKAHGRISRKVVLGPIAPVELHARLILHQHGIRLWDAHFLEHLMTLYNLPYIPSWLDHIESAADLLPVGIKHEMQFDSRHTIAELAS